jgi:mono/diheme cytochrome c family protein
MRYFVLGFFLFCVAILAIAGLRYDHGGGPARKPPLEFFPDMDRQPKLRPQTHNSFFNDGLSSRLPVEGAVPRTEPRLVNGELVSNYENSPLRETALNTGKIPGTTNWIELSPLPITESLLKRGQDRYTIYCAVCHSPAGDGKGITGKYGMVGMANFHDKRLVLMADGEIFNTITHGKNLMGSYAAQIEIEDRWAIIAYLRALQRGHLGNLDDVPADKRAGLK